MQGSWYKHFLKGLKYYYKIKKNFFFILTCIVFLKIISISLDIYMGYFPNIFHDIVILNLFSILYFKIKIIVEYWFNSLLLIEIFLFCCFWFFVRPGNRDFKEINRREILEKEQQIKEKEANIEKEIVFLNVSQKKSLLKKKIKNFKNIIKKII